MSNKLFVGNLAWSVTSERLSEVFSAFGPVVEAKVLMDRQTGRSRGFGFVTFQNEADADRATAEMHNQEIDGRSIRCDNTQQPERKEHRPRENREGRENNRESRGYGRRDDNQNREDRPRREFHHDDHSRNDNRAPRSQSYDRYNYNVSDFPPDPERMSRNDRRNNRRKDRNHDDDDRW